MPRDQRPPGDGRGRPGKGGPVSPSPTKISTRVTEPIDIRSGSCPCGCLLGVDCVVDRPAPVVVNHGCHCGPLGLDGIKAAAALGIYCAPGRCVYDNVRVAS